MMKNGGVLKAFSVFVRVLQVTLYLNLGVAFSDAPAKTFLYPVSVIKENRTLSETENPVFSYSEEEFLMLVCVVRAEVQGGSRGHKRLIAEVVLNRVESNLFPDTISGVLTQKGQFPSIFNYYRTRYEPDSDTLLAVKTALERGKDSTGGALYFYAPRYTGENTASWFEEELIFLFEREEGCFGQVYTHRFFK